MGKHKHKKSKKSKKSSKRQDSSDEWEETTVVDEETLRSKTHSKMKKPVEDEDDDITTMKSPSTSRSETRNASRSSHRPSWRKQEFQHTGDVHESAQQSPTAVLEDEAGSKPQRDVATAEVTLDKTVEDSSDAKLRRPDEVEPGVDTQTRFQEASNEPPARNLHPEQDNEARAKSPRVATVRSASKHDTNLSSEVREDEVLSDDKMNQLSAKILKAELRGDQETVQRLKKKLESATRARQLSQQSTDDTETRVVVLAGERRGTSDRSKRSSNAGTGRANKKKMRSEDAWGCLEDKFVRKKVEDDEKMDAVLQRAINRMEGGSSRLPTDANEDHDFDDEGHQDTNAEISPVKDRARIGSFVDSCSFCIDSPVCVKHLIAYSGQNVSLMLPRHESLTDYHCLLVPKDHVPVLTQADEETWTEMQDLRKILNRIFEAEGMDCVFLQTANVLSRRSHAVMHCVPVAKESSEMMPMYFKKAIEECETEWSMNKKLVRLTEGGVRKCIPKGLPYFAVDFGEQNGYAHVIEDRDRFPEYFGLEIIGSVLDVSPSRWLRPRSESFQDQSKKVIRFEELWSKHEPDRKLTV